MSTDNIHFHERKGNVPKIYINICFFFGNFPGT